MSGASTLIRPKTFRNYRIPRYDEVRPDFFVPRHWIPKELLASEADTQGWDCASAVRLPQVNQALAKANVSPKDFQLTVQSGWEIEGKFGLWTMARGGSGSIVFLKMPLNAVTMKFSGMNMNFSGGSATIQVKLNYLPQPSDKPDPQKGDQNNLVTNPTPRSADDPAVVVQRIDYGPNPVPDEMKALFLYALGKWFNENLATFNYVFAVVSLNQLSTFPQFQWLKPTYTSYAYYNGGKDDPDESAYFGVLTMTGGRSPDGLANQLPASAIPVGLGGGLLIGMKLYLENLVLPGALGAFPKASINDFSITNDNTSIVLNHNMEMEPVTVGLLDYTPIAEEFILQIVGEEIQTRTKIHVPISPGIDAYVTTESWYKLKLTTKDDGKQTITWEESRPAKKDHWYVKATWVTITEAIVAIIGAVAAFVAGKILTGIVRVVVIIIIAIVAGLAAAVPELIAKIISDGAAKALPPIEKMLEEFVQPVEWPDTLSFLLKSVQLNGSFQLSGDFVMAGG
ncbi:hypothetical protein CCAX7_009660 [Capsulimonas corticalis]|uniref:Protein OrfX2/OrfX3/P47 domain-containing protein n=1 Tax=Capsulimonas corticalis TaxID=2219043 RepID=A0A402CUB7_9BACT|nr:TULIP family P47-like protein [Capsulimonas corticalis]BDI28915.1 hypothetical protein CCAX7_009660 [Capsulimonas corticalis]